MKKILQISVMSLSWLVISHPVLGATIGLFNNPQYISQNASANLINILQSLGHQVNQFTSFDTAAWQAVAHQNQLLFIPSQGRNILPQLSLETRNVITNYVATGGGFISAGVEEEAVPFLNGLFGWNLEEDFSNSPFILNTVNAAGTVFESAPFFVRPAFPTTPLSIASLPVGAKSIYDNEENSTALFVNQIGLGQFAYISFGYGSPEQEPNWATVTDLTVEFVAKDDTPTPIPEPSLILSIIPSVFGFFKFRARVGK